MTSIKLSEQISKPFSRSQALNKHRLLTFVILAAFSLSISLSPMAVNSTLAGPTAATVSFSTGSGVISGCDTLNVEVWVNDVANLYGAEVRINFDPAVLEVLDGNPGKAGVNVINGGFLVNPFIVYDVADNTNGIIRYVATQLNPTPPANGSGELFTITFRAKTQSVSTDLLVSFVALSDRDGHIIPSGQVNGALQTNPPTPPSLSIARLNSSDVTLSWSATAGAAAYNLYRATTPYFTPVDPPYHTTTSLSFNDPGALGNTTTQYYYLIQSSCTNGFNSENSNRVGEYDFPLRAAGASNYNDISMVFINPALPDAKALASYVGSSARAIISYNPVVQTNKTYLVGIDSTNFTISTGQFLFVLTNNTAPASFALVGNVPDPGAISFSLIRGLPPKYNAISLPLDQSSLTMASQVAADFGGGVLAVSAYQINTQSYRTYLGTSGTDFPLVIGEPFRVLLNNSAPAIWP